MQSGSRKEGQEPPSDAMAKPASGKLSKRASKQTAIVSSSHLAGEEGWQLSELEYALIMMQNAFSRWTVYCMNAAGREDLSALDIMVLHNLNHREREKRLTDIAFMLNIDDSHTVNYSIKKLVKAGLVCGRKVGKEMLYKTTREGIDLCARYGEIRKACLVDAVLATNKDFDEVSHLALVMRGLSGTYDQASRSASSL